MDQHTSGDGHACVPCLRPAWRDFAQAGETDYSAQARGGEDRKTGLFQMVSDQIDNVFFIFNNQDGFRMSFLSRNQGSIN